MSVPASDGEGFGGLDDDVGGDPTGVLIVRVWRDRDRPGREVRARLTGRSGLGEAVEVGVAADIEEILRQARDWLEAFAESG